MRFALKTVIFAFAISLCLLSVASSAWSFTYQATKMQATGLVSLAAPPSQAPVCLADTGLNLTPDTSANTISREAIDGGPVGDAHGHGTLLAQAMGGADNGWGQVGLWPQVRLISVRASQVDGHNFDLSQVADAISRCQVLGAKVISLSLAAPVIGPQSTQALEQAISAARAGDINIVAATGNNASTVGYPARLKGVFAVAGHDRANNLWTRSNHDSETDILAPGNELDISLTDGSEAGAEGTSWSAALVATAIAALRSYQPDLSATDAERIYLETSQPSSAGPVINVSAAFASVGLNLAARSQALPTTKLDTKPISKRKKSAKRLAKPRRVRAVWRRGSLRLRAVFNRRAKLLIKYRPQQRQRTSRRLVRILSTKRRLKIAMPFGAPKYILVASRNQQSRSKWRKVKVKRNLRRR